MFSTRKHDGEKIRITIKRTAELSPKNPQCIQIFNIMFRQILSDLELKEVQRAYFDPASAVTLPRHKYVIAGLQLQRLPLETSELMRLTFVFITSRKRLVPLFIGFLCGMLKKKNPMYMNALQDC